MSKWRQLQGSLAFAFAILSGAAAKASDLSALDIHPLTYPIGQYMLHLGVHGSGAVYTANQPAGAGSGTAKVTGATSLTAKIDRLYDSGIGIALKGTFNLYHDQMSGDIYGNRFVEKLYADIATNLGRIEIGDTDGAGYQLAVTGPVVDEDVSLDDSSVTFFRNPATKTAFVHFFPVETALQSSLNYAKVSYYSPRLFGFELATSFTPSEAKGILPFAVSSPIVANRQDDIWEIVGNYVGYYGAFSYGAFGGLAVAHNAGKTALHAGLTDWAAGAEIDYAINESLKVAVGGAFHETNADAFNINSVFAGGTTHANHFSTVLSDGRWSIGAEYSDGTASAAGRAVSTVGYAGSVGYKLNANWRVTAGWEQRTYGRGTGIFYNGLGHVRMDAVFLHVRFDV